MKKGIVTLLFATAFAALAGCASPNIKHSDSEKNQIAAGTLIDFTEERIAAEYAPGGSRTITTQQIDNKKLTNGVYVCAISYIPSYVNHEKCFPNLSSVISKYLTDAGLKVTKDRESSDVVVYFRVKFGYVFQGISIDEKLMEQMDISLENGNKLSVNIKEPQNPSHADEVANENNKKDLLSGTASIIAARVVATALHTQMPLSVGDAYHPQATCIERCLNQLMYIEVSEYDPKTLAKIESNGIFSGGSTATSHNYAMAIKYRTYNGPVKPNDTFPILFDKAMQATAVGLIAK